MNDQRVDKVVILAAGMGTRLRRDDGSVELTSEQAAVADAGIKALIPIDRPFLDYVLNEVADAGPRQVCLVIGPGHDAVRDYYGGLVCERLRIEFAVQNEPKGTADALAAAADFVGPDTFLAINSDNHYPSRVLRTLGELDGNGVAGVERRGLCTGNIPPGRLAKFAVILADAAGDLERIIEKPDPELLDRMPDPVLINMNCWRFGPSIIEACRSINPSPRGEFELPDAVMYSIDHLGDRYRVVPADAPVLDLSGRNDIEAVADRLVGVEVHL